MEPMERISPGLRIGLCVAVGLMVTGLAWIAWVAAEPELVGGPVPSTEDAMHAPGAPVSGSPVLTTETDPVAKAGLIEESVERKLIAGGADPAVDVDRPDEVPTRVIVRVIDEQDRGVRDVTVRVATPGRWGTFKDLRTVTTQIDGQAIVQGLAADMVWAEVDAGTLPPGHVACERVHGSLKKVDVETLTLVCPRAGTLLGQVTRADGSPLAGVFVRAVPLNNASCSPSGRSATSFFIAFQ